jgi:hemerythrin-like metal-binding protein
MTMDFAQWTENLSVDIEIIDEQHKKLIAMLNEVAMGIYNNTSDLKEILKGLKEYTEVHFGEEEELFRKSEYPDIQKHLKEHKYFIGKLAEFERDSLQNDVSVSLNLLQFLKDWLFYHIEIIDESYAPYVKKIRHSENS